VLFLLSLLWLYCLRATEEFRNEVRQLKEALVCNRDLRDEVTYLTSELKNVRTEIDFINKNLSTAGSPSLREWPPLDVNNQSYSVTKVVSEAGAPAAAVQSKSARRLYMLTPILNQMTAVEHSYNSAHVCACNYIQHTNSQLKQHFPSRPTVHDTALITSDQL